MILTVSEAIDEYTARFTAATRRAPTEPELSAAAHRFMDRYQLAQGVRREDFDAFLDLEALPKTLPDIPAQNFIYVPEAQDVLAAMWESATGSEMDIQKIMEGLTHYGATSGVPIDSADFELWATWWIKRETRR